MSIDQPDYERSESDQLSMLTDWEAQVAQLAVEYHGLDILEKELSDSLELRWKAGDFDRVRAERKELAKVARLRDSLQELLRAMRAHLAVVREVLTEQ